MVGLENKIQGVLSGLEKQSHKVLSVINEVIVKRAVYLAPGEYQFVDRKWNSVRLPVISRPGETLFLRGTVQLPTVMDGSILYMRSNFNNAEGLFSLDGMPYCGLDSNHRLVPLPRTRKNSRLHFGIEFYFLDVPCFNPEQPHIISSLELVSIKPSLLEYYYNLKVAFDAWHIISPRERGWLGYAVQNSIRKVDLCNKSSVVDANRVLKKEVFHRRGIPARDFSFTLVGHSHIDTAWLWPIAETIRKCGRTFTTALRLMETDPRFIFCASQPQQYQFIKEYYPEIYRQLKEKVAEGRWETIGGFWVEPDCNLISGESLVRQILYGKRFFKKEFGKDVHTAWLPDTFGFTASLPQVLKEANIHYFYTNKMYWQSVNRFPYSLFWWEGINGSRVLAHTPKLESGYNGYPNPFQFKEAEAEFRQKDKFPKCLFPFGYGDGGGGVTFEMLAYAKRLADFPGLPKSEVGRVEDYFQEATREAKDLPIWRGELYLETHQGCYTSQARTKKNNRTVENLLYTVELLQSLNSILGKESHSVYLSETWKKVLTFQFHDILPGSSIAAVYQEIEPQYQAIIATLNKEIEKNLKKLSAKVSYSQGKGEAVLLFNTLNWERKEVVEVKPGLVLETDVPACGYRVYYVNDKEKNLVKKKRSLIARKDYIENRYFSLSFNDHGRITRLFDRVNCKEVIPKKSCANDFLIFKDGPLLEEAWNIDPDYEATRRPFGRLVSRKVLESGPARTILHQVFKDGNSTISQDIIIYENIGRIDFRTNVYWQERRKMLKVAFPVSVNAKRAFYEIPFGAIGRPTTNRNSWEMAKKEVVGLRWADLSGRGYGVSLLNDCKYGYDIKGNTMRLTLLRAPTYPDPESDKGTHEFTYSLFPHRGDWRNAEVVKHGYHLNQPILVLQIAKPEAKKKTNLPEVGSLLQMDGLPVVVSAFKQSEDNNGYVLRVYEPNGCFGQVRTILPVEPKAIWETNLLEDKKRKITRSGRVLIFSIKPFQIKTFYIVL